jgi:HK97 family phage major capsid protein
MTAPVIPATPDELEDFLGDKDKIQASITDGSFKTVIKNYARTVYEKDVDLTAQVKEETQRVLAQWLKDNGESPDRKLNLDYTKPVTNAYHKIANPRAAGAPLNKLFENVGDFATTVWNATHPGGHLTGDALKKIAQIRNYQEKVPAEGGFLVPEEFRAELLRVALETSIVRPRARVVPMGSSTLRFPMIDSTSNVSSVYGGVVAYWTEEGAELTESSATFGSIKLEAWKLTALAHVTNELLRDAAGGFQMFLEEIFPEAIAYHEDLAFLGGNGVGQPLGLLATGNTATVVVAKETGQVAATVVWENIIKMYSRMLPGSLSRAVWVASPDTFAQLATMALSVGTGGVPVWLTDGTQTPQLSLLGRPIIMTEKAPAAVGTQGDLSFVDPSMYLIGDRQQMSMDSSPHVKFTSDKTTFRIISRVDGRPWLQSAITPHNNSSTLSPYIQLATRA